MKPLHGIKVLDLSHRLPGPLAGKLLSDLGAEVVKLEDTTAKDPFLAGMFSAFDNSFEDWYEQLNQHKKIERFSFRDEHAKKQMHQWLLWADAVILSLSPKLKTHLGLDRASLASLTRPMAIVELGASREHKAAMHDLNALAESGYLKLYIQDFHQDILPPPFLPFAGIGFGQQIATQVLAGLLHGQKMQRPCFLESYLYDEMLNVYKPFWSPNMQKQGRTKFLHNGAYPCYALYRTKDDQYLAVAAVEEKFWADFIDLFGIQLPLEKRFDTDSTAFAKVSQVICTMSSADLTRYLEGKDICVSLVKRHI